MVAAFVALTLRALAGCVCLCLCVSVYMYFMCRLSPSISNQGDWLNERMGSSG